MRAKQNIFHSAVSLTLSIAVSSIALNQSTNQHPARQGSDVQQALPQSKRNGATIL